ncbi:MAG: DUF971 domain-containing protein [Melioribacteraceae bacterium]|nr:DUF971 domain-containing protein [Melioribacteraceae bacterium]
MSPKKITVSEGKHLKIIWSNEEETTVKLSNLRRLCPCANCVSEMQKQSDTYIPIYSTEQLKIKSINLVGSYAVGIIWGDDHNTGIYNFNYLRDISENR